MRALWAMVITLGISAQTMAELRLGIHADEPAPAIAELLSRRLPATLQITARVYEDSQSLQAALRSGELDLAFVDEPLQAIPGASIVSYLYPSVLHIVVAKSSPSLSMEDILAAPGIWAGTTGGIGHSLVEDLARDYAVSEPNLLADPWSSVPEVYFIFGGLLAADALGRLNDYELYSLDTTLESGRGSVAEGIALRYPNLRAFILPAQLYPTLSRKPALTLAVNTILIAREDLEEDLVYELAMAISRLQPEIAAMYPLAGLAGAGRPNSSVRTMPLHAGAQRFADREQPGLIERYAEFVGAAVTTGVALITLGVALYRRRRQARKDRLDIFYQQALRYRDALASNRQPPKEIAVALRKLQEQVFDLLIAERIDADAALLAFMTLSNQLLREAEPGTASS